MSNILVVDDEKNVLKTLSIGLRRYKYNVKQAQSGAQALRIMEETPCEVVVSDIRMSPMDGYALVSQIKEKYPDTGIVLMSAFSFENEKPELQEKIVCPRLTKPFPISALVQAIHGEESGKDKKSIEAGNPKQKILVIGEEKQSQKISDFLSPSKFFIKCVHQVKDVQSLIKSCVFDLFIIDGQFIDTHDWKILNDIDRFTPDNAAVLLVEKKEGENYNGKSDIPLIVIDRERFFRDKEWTVDFLVGTLN